MLNGKNPGVMNILNGYVDLPNKVRDTMGLTVDVNLYSDDNKDFIEIVVNPSMYPINYRGEFHYRTGSTKQQLTGLALAQFLMDKSGVKWEDTFVEDVSLDDIDEESIKIFKREARRSGRMTDDDLDVTNEELLNKLNLSVGGKLRKSAVLLFTNCINKAQSGFYVKIGKFSNDSDLQYQDTFEGSLINTADKIVDVIYLKYLKAKISYVHDRRIETYPYEREAIREAIYNALVHNFYMEAAPIQIKITDNTMTIYNSCQLPEGWTIDTLLNSHRSIPYNPSIASVFYRAGYIENWGKGISKIYDACAAAGAEMPVYEIVGYGISITFNAIKDSLINQGESKGSNEPLNEPLENRILNVMVNNSNITYDELVLMLNVSKSTIKRCTKNMIENGIISREGSKRYGYWKINK